MQFCERLKDFRIKMGMTSKAMAKEIGVAPSTYSQYENGTREPNLEKLKLISEALLIPVNDLLLGVGHDSLYKLTEDERELIRNFRTSDSKGKEIILTIARHEVSRNFEEFEKTLTPSK